MGTAPQVGPAAPLFDAWAARLPSPLADLAGLRAEVVHCRAPVVPGEGLHSVVELRAELRGSPIRYFLPGQKRAQHPGLVGEMHRVLAEGGHQATVATRILRGSASTGSTTPST